jgi:hypothetical protein
MRASTIMKSAWISALGALVLVGGARQLRNRHAAASGAAWAQYATAGQLAT